MGRFGLHLIVASIALAAPLPTDNFVRRDVRREGISAQRRNAVVGSLGQAMVGDAPNQSKEATVDDTMSDAETDSFVRREEKRDTPIEGLHSPSSTAVRRSVRQHSSAKSIDRVEMEDMIEFKVQHQSDAHDTRQWSPMSSLGRLVAKDDCLKLNRDGFPLNVPQLLHQFPKKIEFFDHLTEIGYGKDLRVEARGRARMRENSCLTKPGSRNSHVIFIGDCMERQSFNAYVRNRREGEQEIGPVPHLIPFDESEKANMVKVAEGIPVWTDYDASYARWFGGDEDSFKVMIRKVLAHNNLNTSQDSITIWFGNGIHPFFREVIGSNLYEHAWVTDREAKLRSFVSNLRSEFPGARLVWGTTGYIDVDLMKASPPYPNMDAFPVIAPKITEMNSLDEHVMQSLGVPVVPRADISAAYRGLQCDGLHSDPHDATGASAWNCPGYPAVEALVLQAGLAELCGGNALESICAPSAIEQSLAVKNMSQDGAQLSLSDVSEAINLTRLKEIPSNEVSKPCEGDCARAGSKGILFIGDSPIRRLFVRMLARLEGLRDADSELLQVRAQRDSKCVTIDKQTNRSSKGACKGSDKMFCDGCAPMGLYPDQKDRLVNITGGYPYFSDGDTQFFSYNKRSIRLRYEVDEEFNPDRIGEVLSRAAPEEFEYVFIGFPLAHILFNPQWANSTEACKFGSALPAELSARFEQIINQLHVSSDKKRTVFFTGGMPYAQDAEFKCIEKGCKTGSCDWPQDNTHVQLANKLHKNMFAKLATDSMRYVNIHDVTTQTCKTKKCTPGGHLLNCPHCLSDGGVHYKYPILDAQLDALVKAFTAG